MSEANVVSSTGRVHGLTPQRTSRSIQRTTLCGREFSIGDENTTVPKLLWGIPTEQPINCSHCLEVVERAEGRTARRGPYTAGWR